MNKSHKTPDNPEGLTPQQIAAGHKKIAGFMTGPTAGAAMALNVTLQQISTEYDKTLAPPAIVFEDQLNEQAAKIAQGDLSYVEGMLLSQASALAVMFAHGLQKSAERKYGSDEHERCLRLALRAQAQCTRALEVLGQIKLGPVVVTRQINAATQQIVNNGHAPERPVRSAKIKKSSHANLSNQTCTDHVEPLDPRNPRETAPTHRHSKTMGAQHRTKNPGRKTAKLPERMEGRQAPAHPGASATAPGDSS